MKGDYIKVARHIPLRKKPLHSDFVLNILKKEYVLYMNRLNICVLLREIFYNTLRTLHGNHLNGWMSVDHRTKMKSLKKS